MEQSQNSIKLIILQILGAPGAIMLGLYLYSTQVAQGHAFHPLLNDPKVLNLMLYAGIFILLTTGLVTILISRKNNT